jgi:hypothetical protein
MTMTTMALSITDNVLLSVTNKPIMPSVATKPIILSVANKPIMLSVVLLNVVAPFYPSLIFGGKAMSLSFEGIPVRVSRL